MKLSELVNHNADEIEIEGLKKRVVHLTSEELQELRNDTADEDWMDFALFEGCGVERREHEIYSGALGEAFGCIVRHRDDGKK